MSWCFIYLFLTLSSLNIVRTVPPDYCLLPLNRSDCNMAPKEVFSYYKPGSRCEKETWRGCPTANKFDNEYLCTLNCIFRRRPDALDDQCAIPLNQNICGEKELVVTHQNGTCIRAWWGGCPTHNMFANEEECAAACMVPILEDHNVTTTPEVPHEALQAINELLDLIIEEVVLTTTEQETESTTEFTTETEPMNDGFIEVLNIVR